MIAFHSVTDAIFVAADATAVAVAYVMVEGVEEAEVAAWMIDLLWTIELTLMATKLMAIASILNAWPWCCYCCRHHSDSSPCHSRHFVR